MKKVFLLKIVYFYSCLFFIVLGRYLSYFSYSGYFSYLSYHSYYSYFAFSELLIPKMLGAGSNPAFVVLHLLNGRSGCDIATGSVKIQLKNVNK